MQLIDTDILIDVQRGHLPAIEWFSHLLEPPFVPGLVVMELMQGARDAKGVRDVHLLVSGLSVVWPTPADCTRAMSDFSIFKLSHGLGLIDSLIGACAIGQSAELCTFNQKHDRAIAGLVTIQPYVR